MKIYKYPVSFGKTIVKLPKGARILTVEDQYGVIKIWAMVDPLAEDEKRTILTVLTGGDIKEDKIINHIGTIFTDNKSFVAHVFEVENDY